MLIDFSLERPPTQLDVTVRPELGSGRGRLLKETSFVRFIGRGARATRRLLTKSRSHAERGGPGNGGFGGGWILVRWGRRFGFGRGAGILR